MGLDDGVGGWAPGLKRSVYHAHPKTHIQHVCPLLQHQKGGASASSELSGAWHTAVCRPVRCFKMIRNWKEAHQHTAGKAGIARSHASGGHLVQTDQLSK